MILVVGATGQLGGLIVRDLLRQGRQVRVLVRAGSSVDELAGAQPVLGDLKDAASLHAACAGVSAVVTTANSTARGGADTVESVDRQGNHDLIDAAAAAGVRRFVFVSALGADPAHPMPLLQAKGEAEQRLRDSGMAWTVLQPDVYMDKLIPLVVGGPALAGEPVTLVGDGTRRHSFVSVHDVAAYAAAALDRPEAEGRTLVIGGPRPVSWPDVVVAFEHELGRGVPVRSVAPGEQVPGQPEFVTGLLTALDSYDSPIDSSELARTYGVSPTTLTAFVHAFVAGAAVIER